GWSASPAIGAILQFEYWDGTAYHPFGLPFAVDASTKNITIARPPAQEATTTLIRLRLISAPSSATTFNGAAPVVYQETSGVPVARVRPFTFSNEQTYTAVLTPGFADFYRDGAYVGSSITASFEDHIPTQDTPQRFDTMLMFHPAVQTQKIMRDGADNKWTVTTAPFENIANVDLGGTYTNQVADVWMIILRFPESGAALVLSIDVNGETAVCATDWPINWTSFAAQIKTQIEATGSIAPGITVTPGTASATSQQIVITFTGDGNLGNVNSLSAQVVNTTDAAATVAHLTIGDPGGEPLISNTRGYAASAAFYQDRLVTGGFQGKKSAWLASVTGEYFDMNVKLTGPSGAVLANLDTDGAEQLQHIVRDNYLLFFTSDAEYFVSDRAIDRTKPPNIVNSSRYGSAPDLPVLANEGEIIFASRNKA
ncbi:hypothetical protein AC629_42695, partial [Bradyrhizobium sp. NAS80.1]|uniref:hypothetical protein n=1 Tax=Bradyrhizobium sp. NAS80.1 TaxID=1680159 RepID=UPI000960F688